MYQTSHRWRPMEPIGASTSNSSNDGPSSWSPSSLSDFHGRSPSPIDTRRQNALPLVTSDTTVGTSTRRPRHRETNRRRRIERIGVISPTARQRRHAFRSGRLPLADVHNYEEVEFDWHRDYPKTLRHVHRRRRAAKPPKFEKFTITIPPDSSMNHSPPTTTDYGTASDENQAVGFSRNDEDSDEGNYDDAATDFMNATEKIYENLRLSRPVIPTPSIPPPPSLLQLDDEASLYGRLTALLLANSRGQTERLAQVEADVRALLQLPTSAFSVRLSQVEDVQVFARSAAIFGHEVAARLRILHSQSPADYHVKLVKLHKLLYGLKKRNPLFGGIGRFVRRLRNVF